MLSATRVRLLQKPISHELRVFCTLRSHLFPGRSKCKFRWESKNRKKKREEERKKKGAEEEKERKKERKEEKERKKKGRKEE